MKRTHADDVESLKAMASGVRAALGASRRRVVASVFRRPMLQVLGGIGVGGDPVPFDPRVARCVGIIDDELTGSRVIGSERQTEQAGKYDHDRRQHDAGKVELRAQGHGDGIPSSSRSLHCRTPLASNA